MGFLQAPGLPYSKLGIPEDGDAASRAISKGKYVIWKGKNYFAKTDILQGETFVEDTNLTEIPDGALNGIADALNASLTFNTSDYVNLNFYSIPENSSYQIPANGFYCIQMIGNGTLGANLCLDSNRNILIGACSGNSSAMCCIPLKKNQTLYTKNGSYVVFGYFPI